MRDQVAEVPDRDDRDAQSDEPETDRLIEPGTQDLTQAEHPRRPPHSKAGEKTNDTIGTHVSPNSLMRRRKNTVYQ